LTVCKHGKKQIECIDCYEEKSSKAITILTRRNEVKKKCQKEWREKKRIQKLENDKKRETESTDA